MTTETKKQLDFCDWLQTLDSNRQLFLFKFLWAYGVARMVERQKLEDLEFLRKNKIMRDILQKTPW